MDLFLVGPWLSCVQWQLLALRIDLRVQTTIPCRNPLFILRPVRRRAAGSASAEADGPGPWLTVKTVNTGCLLALRSARRGTTRRSAAGMQLI